MWKKISTVCEVKRMWFVEMIILNTTICILYTIVYTYYTRRGFSYTKTLPHRCSEDENRKNNNSQLRQTFYKLIDLTDLKNTTFIHSRYLFQFYNNKTRAPRVISTYCGWSIPCIYWSHDITVTVVKEVLRS